MNLQQQRFVDEYLIDGHATNAAIRAGYSKKTARIQASALLTKPHIKAAIEAKQAKLSAKLELTAERVLSELALIGFSNMLDYIRIGDDGQPYTDFSALTRDQAAAIGEVTVETRKERRGGEDKTTDTIEKVRFKLSDKRAALVDIGKHLGLFKEQHEHKVAVEHSVSDLDLARWIAFQLTQADRSAKGT